MSFEVVNPGILSLLQDAGRFGQHQIGLTSGGPMDPEAFMWANTLCGNDENATAIEVTIGGLQLKAQKPTSLSITGAEAALTVNGQPKEMWRSHSISAGDEIQLGYASSGARAYLAVAGGFTIEPQFGSTATVIREGIGGLSGNKLNSGDTLPYQDTQREINLKLPDFAIPKYHKHITLRVIPGYQEHHFERTQQRLFFHNTYQVSERCDRMGFRLEGPAVECNIGGILSEGICLGAIQIPADGQPIVLMSDRQTIGGYPKIGSVLSLDLGRLAQLTQGDKVSFAPITIDCAHNALHLAKSYRESITLEPIYEP